MDFREAGYVGIYVLTDIFQVFGDELFGMHGAHFTDPVVFIQNFVVQKHSGHYGFA
jgi:hypothetical protein